MKILITGGTNGMGKGVAKILASIDNQEHEIIILCRSKQLGESTIREFEHETSNRKITMILCDLTRLGDVRNAVTEIRSKYTSLDGIFINAGLGYAAERVETEDGFDPHFQVNYLSHFLLILNLLNLLENSESGGRVIFNVTRGGEIFWNDMQQKNKWTFEKGIHQAMTAKRMLLVKLNNIYQNRISSRISFIGFEIPKTVWSNQLTIIPASMRIMATIMKFFGKFISIEECGKIMAPLFIEPHKQSMEKSGKFITWKKDKFIEMKEDSAVLDQESQDRLWQISLDLCADKTTREIAESIQK